MKSIVIFLVILLPAIVSAQHKGKDSGGNFSLGMRSSLSAFNHGSSTLAGIGYGGQFRVQLTDRVNTEWFADYMNMNLADVAYRQDAHIGWSLMYYILDNKSFNRLLTPYIEAGHCFDYTAVQDYARAIPKQERWSSAVQMGAGTHINVSRRFDFTLKSQYMLHLGNSLHAEVQSGELQVEKQKGASAEGHLFFILSVNYKIAELW